jgi:hypothetical protein
MHGEPLGQRSEPLPGDFVVPCRQGEPHRQRSGHPFPVDGDRTNERENWISEPKGLTC